MNFEIDVSGEDIFSSEYTICIADDNDIIKGFKFNKKLIQILRSRHGQGEYKYGISSKQKALFKVRVYCIIIFYLFKSIKNIRNISLTICRDFDGKENDIDANLKYLLGTKLGISIESIMHIKLKEDSKAHAYACLMRKDFKNQMKTYIDITIKDIEEFLKK